MHNQRETGNDGLSRARLTSVSTNEADVGLDVAMFDSKERSWTRQVGSISVIFATESGIPFLAYRPWHDQFTSLSLPDFPKLRRSPFTSSPPAFPLEHARTSRPGWREVHPSARGVGETTWTQCVPSYNWCIQLWHISSGATSMQGKGGCEVVLNRKMNAANVQRCISSYVDDTVRLTLDQLVPYNCTRSV